MSFEAKSYLIRDIFNKAVFEIPRNQRRYVWKEEQWQDLLEDIIFSISEKKSHFIGSIVLKHEEVKEGIYHYTIIDGQQRLITITLLLLAVMKIFYERGMIDDFSGTAAYLMATDDKNKNVIMMTSNYHIALENLTKGILNLDEENSNLTMNAFVNVHVGKNLRDKNIGNAIRFFYDKVMENISNDGGVGRLIDIKNSILNMTSIRIVADTDEDSYTIFEILNARGQTLNDCELLKNYVMRYIQPENRRDEAKVNWEIMEQMLGNSMNTFVKHYVTHYLGGIPQGETFYQAIKRSHRGHQAEALLEDIVLKAGYYNIIINPKSGEEGNCSLIEENIFKFFKSKRLEQFRPVLLSLIHQRELGQLSNEKYESTIKYIFNFFVCYIIIGEEKSNKLQNVVGKYAPMLENNYSDEAIEDFIKSLKAKIPDYDWFLGVFKNVGYSHHFERYSDNRSKKRVQVILEVIEQYVSKRDEIGDFTIEHICPDFKNEENAQIGNLIPLESWLNDRCKDQEDLKEKYKIYRGSSFKSARGIELNYTNDDFSPEKRTNYLAKLIYKEILKL